MHVFEEGGMIGAAVPQYRHKEGALFAESLNTTKLTLSNSFLIIVRCRQIYTTSSSLGVDCSHCPFLNTTV